MTRRGFFARLAAVASAAAAPALARLAPAKPKPIPAYRFGMDVAPGPSLSIRIIQSYDQSHDRWITRMDVLYGYAACDFGGLPMPAHPSAIDPGAPWRVPLAG